MIFRVRVCHMEFHRPTAVIHHSTRELRCLPSFGQMLGQYVHHVKGLGVALEPGGVGPGVTDNNGRIYASRLHTIRNRHRLRSPHTLSSPPSPPIFILLLPHLKRPTCVAAAPFASLLGPPSSRPCSMPPLPSPSPSPSPPRLSQPPKTRAAREASQTTCPL